MKTKLFVLSLIAVVAAATLSFTFSSGSQLAPKEKTQEENVSPIGGIAAEDQP